MIDSELSQQWISFICVACVSNNWGNVISSLLYVFFFLSLVIASS